MKRQNKKRVNKGGGYPGPRDPATGFTPRQLVDSRRAHLLGLEIAEKSGALVKKSEVEEARRQTADVLQSDLFGALPSRCATELGGKLFTAEQVRSVVLKIVYDIVGNWIDAEIVPKESKPNENT